MVVELTNTFEQNREKYKDFRSALSDSNLDQNEKQELSEKYYWDCHEIHEQTQRDCSDLLKEVELYTNMKQMSREEIKKLQILSWIQNVDGLRGPTTFATYLEIWNRGLGLENLSPWEVVSKYEEVFLTIESKFKAISNRNERREIQRKVWAVTDGHFWPNTFKAIMKNPKNNEDIITLFFDSPVVENTDDIEESLEDKSEEQVWEDVIQANAEIIDQETPEVQEVSWDTPEITTNPHPDVFVEAQEEELLSSDEKRTLFKLQAKEYTRGLIRELQSKLWNVWVDGSFWNQSANRVIEKFPNAQSLDEVFNLEWINTDIDGILSSDGNPEVFRELYGEYIEKLWSDLGLPHGFIEAIIRKETTYGMALNSPTWSKGMMQLTQWPFRDMRWDYTVWKWESARIVRWGDSNKVLRYRAIFQKIDLNSLLGVEIWDKWLASTRIPDDIISAMRTIQTSENISEIQEQINLLLNHIKWDKHSYDHETNMIIGSVYLSYLYENRWWNIWKTARDYNWDIKLWSNGKQIRYNYADTVKRYYNNLSSS